jgi:2-polyprenyl-6-methoxyphenol hydroxylase-like FAD-dependent oxidoreductase
MGILDDLVALNNRIKGSSYHDRSGRAVLDLDYDRLFEEGGVVQIMRDDLESVLYAHAKSGADFLFANSVSKLEQDGNEVMVGFDDGREQAFDVVIGADGLHSRVRQLAFAEGEVIKHRLGLQAAAFRCPNVLGLTHKYEAYMEPNRHTIVYTTRSNDLACIFMWKDDGLNIPPEGQARLDHLSDAFDGADPRSRKLIESRKPDDRVYMEALTQIEMPSWRKGRVCIVGDGAHSLTQISGQGASMAIAGASALARALSEHSPDEAFAEYDTAIRPIVSQLQPATRDNAKWYVPGGVPFHLLRVSAMRFLPNELWVRYFKSKYSRARD